MIHEMTPLTLAEVKELVSDMDEKKNIEAYLKKFNKLNSKKAKELFDELDGLNNVKFKREHIVKIVDFLPEDSEDVNKIFSDVSLTEEEINAILEIVRKY